MRRCIAANLYFLPNPTRRTLAKLFIVCILCVSFYLLGIYNNSLPDIPASGSTALLSPDAASSLDCLDTRPNLTVVQTTSSITALDFEPHHLAPLPPDQDPATGATSDAHAAGAGEAAPKLIPFCPANFTDYCPCQDPNRERFFPVENLSHRERHCPGDSDRVRCRVPRPKGYRTPFRWPESRDRAWFANVPSKRLVKAKADQNWVRVEGQTLVFPGGGTSFPGAGGVKGYVAEMAKLVPLKTGEIRTALDLGCGVASFGGHLLDYNIMTLSVAPRDVHEAQVQFALERGLPAMLGVLSTHRLPYPSRSFDMAHCARCLIRWDGYGGMLLLEIDRLLRPGGYWVLSGPPINWRHFYKGWRRTAQDLEAEQKSIEDLAKRLCWEKVKEKGVYAVWRKPFNHVTCKKSKISNPFPYCDSNPDAAWYEKMKPCLTPLPKVGVVDIAGGAIERWPKRLNSIPPRISMSTIMGITSETFNDDNRKWKKRLAYYDSYLHLSSSGKYRNIMDMNAEFGGFAAALNKYPFWVMNVIPVASSTNNTLGVIYERGLIGTYMNWCEAFSTYPRTYDLVHANGIFSLYAHTCDVLEILLEVDRILRPEGAVIIRDHVDHIVKAKRVSDQLGWQSRIVHSDMGDFDPEKLLIVDNSVNLHQHQAGRS